jgi:hypothetical protein
MPAPRILATFWCALLVLGCASFSDRPAPPDWTGPANPISASLTTSGSSLLQIGRDDWKEMPQTSLPKVAADAIWNSGWVVRTSSESDASTRLELKVTQYQGAGPGLFSLLTVFVIPGWIDHRINLELTSSTPLNITTRCSRSVQMRTWYQTLLIFAYPFRSPAYGRIKASEAMALDCLAEVLGEYDASAGR